MPYDDGSKSQWRLTSAVPCALGWRSRGLHAASRRYCRRCKFCLQGELLQAVQSVSTPRANAIRMHSVCAALCNPHATRIAAGSPSLHRPILAQAHPCTCPSNGAVHCIQIHPLHPFVSPFHPFSLFLCALDSCKVKRCTRETQTVTQAHGVPPGLASLHFASLNLVASRLLHLIGHSTRSHGSCCRHAAAVTAPIAWHGPRACKADVKWFDDMVMASAVPCALG